MDNNDDVDDDIAADMAVTSRHMDHDVAAGAWANLGLIYTAHINSMIILAQPKIQQ